MKKNVVGQKIRVFAFNRTTNVPVTGDAANITCKVSKDNGATTALADTNPTETEDGFYLFDLTQEETNADTLDFYPESSTLNVVVIVPNYNRQTVSSKATLENTYPDISAGIEEIILMLRILIQDPSGAIYSDASLHKLCLVSSIIVQQELRFSENYVVSISLGTITPDPIDSTFQLFVAHKAAILLLESEIKGYSSQSIKIVDGPSTIDLSNRSKDSSQILKLLYDNYSIMKRDYILSANGGGSFGFAVITPTTVSYITGNNFS